MPGRSIRSTIVYRLWLALSNIAVVFTTLTLGVYVWLSVGDTIDHAYSQTSASVEALALTGVPLGTNDDASLPFTQIAAIRGLGIQRIDIYDSTGLLMKTQAFVPGLPSAPRILSAEAIGRARNGFNTYTTVKMVDDAYQPESISPWQVIKGGNFGAEQVLPLSKLDPNETGAVRVITTYPDLTSEAHTLIARSVTAGLFIVGAILIGMWLLLRHFVTRPLQRYSELAMRIAIGERVRMPANGHDELNALGRAINGMADALEHQATVDALTGLHNLRHLSSQLEVLLAEAADTDQPLSIIFCDLDNLKQINDTYGHDAGDAVLRAVAAAIRVWSGATYACWRLGGDEFVIALPNVDATDAMIRGEKLRKAIATTLIPIEDTHIRTSISIGIASYPEDGNSPALLGIADRRMYESKAALGAERRLVHTSAA
jgi:diguanylate cyclase (GGDEF)-like protein